MNGDYVSGPQSRRAVRAAARRKKRKRNVIVFGSIAALVCVVAVVLLVVLLPAKSTPGKSRPQARDRTQVKEKSVPEATATTAQVPAETAPAATAPATAPPAAATAPPPPPAPALVKPMDSQVLYPYTKAESAACGHWPSGSGDYPYFGAPREGSRLHAGVDVYPASGVGTPVKALKAGKVIKIGVFYTRADGEQTYGVLVDHGDFVANYAEMRSVKVQVGQAVTQGQVLGLVSGTKQLHFEMYTPGTTNWLSWYGAQPSNLLNPTDTLIQLMGN